jgi:predicted nucleic acid-binding protein
MNVDCLLDSNVLLYAVSSNPQEATEQSTAAALLRKLNFGLSAQVLQEFYVTATRKLKPPLNHESAMTFINNLSAAPCAVVDRLLVEQGAAIAARYQISYWDGAIIAAAERLGAPIVYSEDFNDGQRYGSVTVVNPFK